MLRYLLKRLGVMLLTLWVIITATFFLINLIPGSPFSNEEKMSAETKAQLNELYGLDKPLYVQYFRYLGNMAKGDLGSSFSLQQGSPVTSMIAQRFPPSFQIGLQGLLFGIIGGLLLGITSAVYRGKIVDSLSSTISLLGVSVPSFIMATLLSYFVGVKWGILPAALFEGYEYSILPSLALSFFVIAVLSRYIRSEMVEVLQQDYIKTAKAKGLSKSAILGRHALRNSLIPSLAVLGPLAANIFTGSLAVEQIFAIPGMGKLFVESIYAKDIYVVIGATIVYSAMIIAIMLIIDIIYGFIDPRIRIANEKR